MAASGHCRGQMLTPSVGRRGQQNDIDARRENVAVGIRANPAVVGGAGQLGTDLPAQQGDTGGNCVGKAITNRHDLHGPIGHRCLQGRSRAPATGADEPHADAFAAAEEAAGQSAGGAG